MFLIPKIEKATIKVSILLLLLLIPFSTFADMGMVVIPEEISIDEKGQNAIVAWNGTEEVLILSTDLKASKTLPILRILPMPTNPSKIKEGSFSAFQKLVEIINGRISMPMAPTFKGEGVKEYEGVEITFHEKIGSHDVTVAKIESVDNFIKWIRDFILDNDLEYREISSKFKNEVSNYLTKGIKFFVFDLVEAGEIEQSVNPLVYRFQTDFLYYPLAITPSSDVRGSTPSEVNIFLITENRIRTHSLLKANLSPKRIGFIYYTAKLKKEELEEIDPEIADLFKSEPLVMNTFYSGPLDVLDKDLIIYTLVKSSLKPEIYWIAKGQKHWIPSEEIFFDYGFEWGEVALVSTTEMASYFPANLIKTLDNSNVYEIVEGKKHWIPSEKVFLDYNFEWKDIVTVSNTELEFYPRAKLVKTENDSNVYYITEKGLKRHLPSPEVFLSYGYKWEDIITVSQTELNSYHNNELVKTKGNPEVYKIEDNQKRWITSEETFNTLGYNWNKIELVNDTELTSYPTGNPIVR
ncbi:MAG: hypothetical protein COY82_02515 [Parcubacteria group bacterium CG_4_10_14_0_8_um_filter_35_7]|nr:MAG: hypothetical protein COY82_02515 [Parcubacteria group bacterium CG_4_10_14_0_8_um_filter_35_7]